MMQTRILTTETELLSLQADWDRIVQSHPGTNMPFYAWDWFYRSWVHFEKPRGHELFIIAVYDNGKLAAVLPLIRAVQKTRLMSVRQLRFCNVGMMPRNTMYYEYPAYHANADVIWGMILDTLAADLRNDWDMIELANVPDESEFRHCIEEEEETEHYVIQNQGLVSPFLPLTGTVDDYLAGLDKKVRYNIKRYVKQFETSSEPHEVRIFRHTDDIAEALQLASAVRAASWKGDAADSPYFAFFRDTLPKLFAEGEAVVLVILFGGMPKGASFRLNRGGVYYGFGTDYDQKYKEHSPGVLMLYYLLHHIVQQGGHAFDFCGGDYHYKKQYTERSNSHSTYQIFHGGIKSRFLYWAKTTLLPLVRKILRKPAPKDFMRAWRR